MYSDKTVKTDKNSKPIPQYFNGAADDFEDLRGRNGAAYAELLDATGAPLNTSDGKLPVRDADVGAKIDVATMPVGGSGKVGWLSAIWHKLGSVILAAGDAIIGRVKVTDGTAVAKVNTDGSLSVQLTGRKATVVQVAMGVSVPANSWWSQTGYTDADAYDKAALTWKWDAGVAATGQMLYSHDGTSQGGACDTKAFTGIQGGMESGLYGRYVGATIKNGDAGSAHALSVWLRLKP